MENTQNIKDLIQKFYPHAKEKLGFEHPVRVVMRQDAENAKDSLGKTAYYDPAEKLIVLYVTDRHPKDVLRSFSHELVHHAQNCRGDLDDLSTDGHYAGDGKGREIEAEAYLLGNGFLVRDWEDGMKFEGVNKMKLTKSQLKGIIEQTVQNLISEKDADRDGSPAPPKWADPDDNDPKVKASLQKKEESVDEQETVVKADVTLPPNSPAQRALDVLTDFINQSDAEDAEFQAVISAIMQKLEEKGVDVANQPASTGIDESDELGVENSLEEQAPPPPFPPGIKSARQLIKNFPYNSKAREDYRTWYKEYGRGKKARLKAKTADALKQIDLMKSLGDKDPLAALTADPVKTADAQKQMDLLKKYKLPTQDIDLEKKIAKATSDDLKKKVAKPSTDSGINESNDNWYNSNLYESLKSKWTKKGE